MIGDSNEETNFSNKLLLTDRQVSKLLKAFANNFSAYIKYQTLNCLKSGGFLGRLLGQLMKIGLPLMKNVLKPLGKSVLILLGFTAAAPAADIRIHKNVLGLRTTTLTISNG